MLRLQRGTVVTADEFDSGMQPLRVDVDGKARQAIGDINLVGVSEVGDEVIVNLEAVELGLGSGGHDIVHVNLTRGLGLSGLENAHVMKLNYTSLQHAVLPIEDNRNLKIPIVTPVGICSLHGQLAPVVWAFKEREPKKKIGYIQTAGGALPGCLSKVVKELREAELLAGHITVAPSYGGELEAISTAGAINHAFMKLGWDAAICGPGPGILGSGSVLGHGGMVALDSAHVSLALGCRTLIIPRMSSGDERVRHRGLSHHSETVLNLLLKPVTVAIPFGETVDRDDQHNWIRTSVNLKSYVMSGLPTTTMNRNISDDQLFFESALAGGVVLAQA